MALGLQTEELTQANKRSTRPTGGLLLGYNPLLPNCA